MSVIPMKDVVRWATGGASTKSVHLIVVEGNSVADNDAATYDGIKNVAGTLTMNQATAPTAGSVNAATGAETAAATGTCPDGLGVVTVFDPVTQEYSRGFLVNDQRGGIGHAVVNATALGWVHKLYSIGTVTVTNSGAGDDVVAYVTDGVVRQVAT